MGSHTSVNQGGRLPASARWPLQRKARNVTFSMGASLTMRCYTTRFSTFWGVKNPYVHLPRRIEGLSVGAMELSNRTHAPQQILLCYLGVRIFNHNAIEQTVNIEAHPQLTIPQQMHLACEKTLTHKIWGL